MKIKLLLPILLFMFSFQFFAQSPEMKAKLDQMKAQKVAFLTSKLELTTSEAEKFWPVYNEFEKKEFTIKHKRMVLFKKQIKNGGVETMTESSATEFLKQMDLIDAELCVLNQEYSPKFKSVLPSVKVVKLKLAEEEFNRTLLKQFKNKEFHK